MDIIEKHGAGAPLALWGGLECTVKRVRDDYFSQMERNGHARRDHDIERSASLGIKAIRYPVLWERTAPDALEDADWSWPDARLPALRELGVTPIIARCGASARPAFSVLGTEKGILMPPLNDALERYAAERLLMAQQRGWTPQRAQAEGQSPTGF